MNSEEKARLRKYYGEVRAKVKSDEKDEAIRNHVLSSLSEERKFFIYQSFRDEVDTARIIDALRERGCIVLVPKICGAEMSAVPYSDKMTTNRFGIREPLSGTDTPCEVALVPLLAVDGSGNRLGYGGGFYDRYFRSHDGILRIGLCFSAQIADNLPAEETDVPLDGMITEDGIRFFREQLDSKNRSGV